MGGEIKKPEGREEQKKENARQSSILGTRSQSIKSRRDQETVEGKGGERKKKSMTDA